MGLDDLSALKSEQTARIVLRDTALYVHIASIIAIYAAEGQAGQNFGLIENIRAAAIILAAVICSIYASNDFYISRIGHFCATHGSGLAQIWEREHRAGFRYRFQKILRVLAVLIVFPGWATVQVVPIVHKGASLLSFGAGLAWLVVLGATAVYLFADWGRSPRDPELAVEAGIET